MKAIGPDALDLLNRMSTNQVLSLEPGQGAPTILTTDRGRILDLIGVVNFGEYALLLTSPGEQQRVIHWLDKYTIMEDMTVEDLTPETTMLTVLGPNSTVRLGQLVDEELADLPPYHTRSVTLGENPSALSTGLWLKFRHSSCFFRQIRRPPCGRLWSNLRLLQLACRPTRRYE